METWTYLGLIASMMVIVFIVWPSFKRNVLADRALFWIRVPERFAVMVLKDKNLRKIYMAVTDQAKLKKLKKIIKETDNKSLFEFVEKGKLIWIGCPWFGNTIDTWFEMSRDEDGGKKDPHCFLDLMERIWDYGVENETGENKEKYIDTWGVDTADPIQVTPKLVVIGEVVNPQKVIYSVTYFQEAINKEILVAWKKAVQGHYYFVYGDDEEAKGKTKLNLEVQDSLDILLGFIDKEENEENKENKENKRITEGEKYIKGSPARMIYDTYGFFLKRVEIRDIDPTDDAMRNALQTKFVARTTAVADIEAAKGKKEAKIIITDGEVYGIKETGKADAFAIKAKLKGKAQGFKSISDDLKLSSDNNPLLIASEMTIEMLKGADYTYLSGDPGNIGSWAMAAVDRMKSGVNKIKSGSDADKLNGFTELEKAWSSLTEEQRDQLIKKAKPSQEKGGN